MPTEFEYGFLSATFAIHREIRRSPRYHWNNVGRGDDRFVIVQWTHNGVGNFHYQDRTHTVGPGEAFIALLPEESRYYYPPDSHEPWEFSWINFYGELSVKLWSILRERFGPVVRIPPGTSVAAEFENLILRAHRQRWKDRYEASALCYQFYLNLWSQLSTPGNRARQNIEQAAAYLRTHYRSRLRVKEAAAYAGVSREHFTRLFHQRYKTSPATFLREERLKAATLLLVKTDLPVQEIAFRTGFYSSAQFGHLFRRKYKSTPLGYRKKSIRKLLKN